MAPCQLYEGQLPGPHADGVLRHRPQDQSSGLDVIDPYWQWVEDGDRKARRLILDHNADDPMPLPEFAACLVGRSVGRFEEPMSAVHGSLRAHSRASWGVHESVEIPLSFHASFRHQHDDGERSRIDCARPCTGSRSASM